MSGQRYKNIGDIDRLRDEYMQALNLQTQLNDMNLQANKVYKSTGSLAPISGLPDTRTAEEKLKDALYVKQSIKSDLSKIYDPQTVEQILVQVEQSPLNSDGGLMRFLANRGQAYIRDLITKYKIGLGGDQDAKVFVKYLEAYYRMRREDNQKLSYVDPNILTQERFKELFDPIMIIINKPESKRFYQYLNINIIRPYERIYNALLSKSLFEQINSLRDIEKIRELQYSKEIKSKVMPDEIKDEIISLFADYNDAFVEIPNTNLLSIEVGKVIAKKKYLDQFTEALEDFYGLFDMLLIDELTNLKQHIVDYISESPNKELLSKAYQQAPSRLPRGRGLGDEETFEKESVRIIPTSKELERMDFKDVHKVFKMLKKASKGEIKWKKIPKSHSEYEKKKLMVEQIEERRHELEELFPYKEEEEFEGKIEFGKGIHGRGLSRRVFSTSVDKTKGVKPLPSYIPFGNLAVNSKKMKSNVLSFKTINGGALRDIKSQVVSPHLISVIDSIVGGRIPSYEDISKLTEDEKNYLYKVSKKANIEDKLKVPAPDKTKIDKDIHRFEVLKGQIMAGNDSKELVREFKVLISKLVKMNLLPKSQANDILIELLDMGY